MERGERMAFRKRKLTVGSDRLWMIASDGTTQFCCLQVTWPAADWANRRRHRSAGDDPFWLRWSKRESRIRVLGPHDFFSRKTKVCKFWFSVKGMLGGIFWPLSEKKNSVTRYQGGSRWGRLKTPFLPIFIFTLFFKL